MSKNVDSLDFARSRLRALRAEKPATQMGQIRWAWPEIKAALEIGHSLTTVHSRLAEVGIDIPYRRLSFYIGRLRREEAGNSRLADTSLAVTAPENLRPIPVPRSGTVVPSGPVLDQRPADRDPLANLRKLSNNRPGFQWDEAPPDKEKLF
jgi:hypothetical protein